MISGTEFDKQQPFARKLKKIFSSLGKGQLPNFEKFNERLNLNAQIIDAESGIRNILLKLKLEEKREIDYLDPLFKWSYNAFRTIGNLLSRKMENVGLVQDRHESILLRPFTRGQQVDDLVMESLKRGVYSALEVTEAPLMLVAKVVPTIKVSFAEKLQLPAPENQKVALTLRAIVVKDDKGPNYYAIVSRDVGDKLVWYRVNDRSVENVPFDTVKLMSPELLFYESPNKT